MASRRRARIILAALAALGCGLLGWGKLGSSQETGGNGSTEPPAKVTTPAGKVEVLFPPHKSVLASGQIDLIAKSPSDSVTVDGKAPRLQKFKAPLRVARLRLSTGFHEIGLGDEKIKFFVTVTPDDHDGPKDWPVTRRHQLEIKGDRCVGCHETSKNSEDEVVGEVKSYKACLECHEPVEFELIHSHPLGPLENCQMCHAMHAATLDNLLKRPVKEACDKCHES
jgi:predicted CXXCH cytochrome family protein